MITMIDKKQNQKRSYNICLPFLYLLLGKVKDTFIYILFED